MFVVSVLNWNYLATEANACFQMQMILPAQASISSSSALADSDNTNLA